MFFKKRVCVTGLGVAEEGVRATGGLLSAGAIEDSLRPEVLGQIKQPEVFTEIPSTNDYLLQLPSSELHGRVVLADRQLAGKGRRGREWQSPDGNIFLSLGWRFNAGAAKLEALSAVAGICTCQALSRIGLAGHGIKWPNDIHVGGAKLAGILVELRSGRNGTSAVIGIGINVNLGPDAARHIDQAWTDLVHVKGLKTTDRNVIVAAVIEELVGALQPGSQGLPEILRERWSGWDLLFGKAIQVDHLGTIQEGEARGITEGGALRVRLSSGPGTTDEIRTFFSGEVSVRRA